MKYRILQPKTTEKVI